jgi:hypothetical protein
MLRNLPRKSHQVILLAASATAAMLGIVAVVPAVVASPLPTVLKFSQLPLNNLAINGAIYNGHDETSYATLNSTATYQGTGAADDFSDFYNTPVVQVNWWGSYLPTPLVPPIVPVPDFLISFESDVPVTPNNPFSHPGTPLLVQTVTRATGGLLPGEFTETPVGPTNNLFLYQALLATPFPEQAGTVYWLKIAGLYPAGTTGDWGWHNRDYTVQDTLANPGEVNESIASSSPPVWHYGDDAVQGTLSYAPNTGVLTEGGFSPLTYNPTTALTDGPPIVTGLSEDLAFQLVTTPEPATLALLALGGALFLIRRPRSGAGSGKQVNR